MYFHSLTGDQMLPRYLYAVITVAILLAAELAP
jgi:hypothetical protein